MDVISNLEFSKRIKENPDGNYLFYGEEDYLKSHAVKSLKEAMGIDEALEIFNYVTLDVLDYTPDKLIDILSMPPMMAEKKLVVLSGLNIKKMTNKSDFNELLDALAHLDEFDYNVLVLTIPNGNITEEMPRKAPTGSLKILSDRLQPVKFEAPTPQKLSLWVMRHFEHHGIKTSQADCSYLVDYCGRNMFVLANEIEKLALYARSQNRDYLIRDDIANICSAEMEYGAFEFSNAILDGRKGEALNILSVMKFKQVEPLMIMGELSGIFSDLLKIKIMLLAGKANQQIATETGINIHKVGIYATSARRMELARLQRIVSTTAETDLAMKFRFDSGYLNLEKLICSL
ncbi:MAG: DNA polymerase III subunit delta [Clostridia bacterium]|nr:DNA polymerase III subunit delta [Clostridia bacterium]